MHLDDGPRHIISIRRERSGANRSAHFYRAAISLMTGTVGPRFSPRGTLMDDWRILYGTRRNMAAPERVFLKKKWATIWRFANTIERNGEFDWIERGLEFLFVVLFPPPKKGTLMMHINGRAPTKWCLPSWKLRADTARYPSKTEEKPEPIVMRCVFLIRLLGEKRWWRFFFRPNSRAPLFTLPYCRSEVGPNGRKSPKKGGKRQTEIKFFQFFKKRNKCAGVISLFLSLESIFSSFQRFLPV